MNYHSCSTGPETFCNIRYAEHVFPVYLFHSDLFGTEDAKKKYIGNTDNTIKRLDFIDCLGNPGAYLKDDKDTFIFTKPQISKAGLVSERTMLRRIRKIESPSEVIGMPLDTYFTLKYFPPKHANLIIEYLKSLDVSSKNQPA